MTRPQIRPVTRAEMYVKAKRATPKRDLESPIQRAIAAFLDLNFPEGGDVFWSATMNGVYVGPKIRAQLTSSGVRPGLYDIIIVPLAGHPLVGKTFHLEVKSDEGRLTREQSFILAALGPLGLARVVRSPMDVQSYLLSQSFNLRARL
jgi:hypothetical protein